MVTVNATGHCYLSLQRERGACIQEVPLHVCGAPGAVLGAKDRGEQSSRACVPRGPSALLWCRSQQEERVLGWTVQALGENLLLLSLLIFRE